MADTENGPSTRRRMPLRSHSSFAARTPTDGAGRLTRRSSILLAQSPDEDTPLLPGRDSHSYATQPAEAAHEAKHGLDHMRAWFWKPFHFLRSSSVHPEASSESGRKQSTIPATPMKPRPGALPRPVGGTGKLGTFSGVFVPVMSNILSILMFLRFGFILGQAGVLGMMGELCGFSAVYQTIDRNRYAHCLLCYQSFDHHVHLRHCDQWDSQRWWRLFLN